ncbi:MAG: hypothetical protein HDS71_03800 [Bacteroidales bacterium]|nr:hypothetical protein [Bacteroidales bacterium]MBD5223163.1 hypothetical protein [Bacteroidales bacterium]
MKKFSLALLTVVASFQLPAQTPFGQPEIIIPASGMNIVSNTGQTFQSALSRTTTSRIPSLTGNSVPDAAKSPKSIIPEGEKSYYITSKDLIVEEDNSVFSLDQETQRAAVLVKQGDDKVSLLCPFNLYPQHEDCYIDGVVDGDKMKFNLPVIIDEYGPFSFELSLYRFDPEEHTYLPVDDSENVLEVQIGENGALSIKTSDVTADEIDVNDESTFPEIVLGVTTNDLASGMILWFIYGTWNMEYTPIELNTAPEGIIFEDWTLAQQNPEMKYSIPGWNRIAGVAIDGTDIYIKGISEYSEDSIIKGTIENGVATFSGIQAAGFCPKIDFFCYFLATSAILNGDAIEVLYDAIPLKLDMDMENKTMKTQNVMMWCVTNPETRSYLNMWFEPMWIANTPEHLNAPLEAPNLLGARNYSHLGSGYLLTYWIPNININGCVLDKSKMYYNIYFNGEILTLNKDNYPTLPENMTNIPADFNDGEYIANMMSDGMDIYGIYLQAENKEMYTTGVQSFYQGSDGVLYSSPLNLIDPGFYDSINGVYDDSGTAITEEFYTMDGVKVTNPTSGIYIRVIKMSDGSTKVDKVTR